MLFSEYDERYKGLFAKPLQRYYPTQKEEHHTQRSMRIQHLEATVRLHAGGGGAGRGASRRLRSPTEEHSPNSPGGLPASAAQLSAH